MKILAIETATEACSAALSIDGEIQQRYQIAPRLHSELILPMVDDLMQETGLAVAGLDAIAFGRGPGSFIGLRIAAGVAQGIAFTADIPVIPVSTLAALAQKSQQTRVLAAIDARMQEVYWACFQRGSEGVVQLVGEEQLTPADQVCVPDDTGSWFGAGTGWRQQGPNIGSVLSSVTQFDEEMFPDAAAVALLACVAWQEGEAVDAQQAQPVYLRDNVANKSRDLS